MLILAGILAALMGSLFLAGNPTTDKSAPIFYENCINKQIRRGLLKEHLYKYSRFEHIRKSAALAIKKAVFLRINRDRLIEEMTEQKVGKKHYHIQAYLDKKFHANSRKENRVAYRSTNSNE